MKIVAVALAVAISLPLYAGRLRGVVPGDSVSIEFVDVPAAGSSLTGAASDGWLEVKTLSHRPGSAGRSVGSRRQFGIRIVRPGGAAWGTARVTARLTAQDDRSTIRIDGRLLTMSSIVIDSHVAIGKLTIHTLEIEVPDSAPPGPLVASISWDVSTL